MHGAVGGATEQVLLSRLLVDNQLQARHCIRMILEHLLLSLHMRETFMSKVSDTGVDEGGAGTARAPERA